MKRRLIFFIALLNCWSVKGQQFSFDVICSGFQETETLYLKKYVGFEELTIDSIKGSGTFTFKFETPFGVNGLYFLSASRNEMAEFLINSNESKLVLSVNKEGLKTGAVGIKNSIENDVYLSFVKAYIDYEQLMYANISTNFSLFDSNVISNVKRQDKYLEKTQADFNAFLSRLRAEYPQTYTANILCTIAKLPVRTEEEVDKYETYHSYLFNSFWSQLPFEKDGILNHFLFNEQLKNYFRHFVPKREDGLKKAVTITHEASKSNSKVNSHIRTFLLRNFLNSNADALSLYVNQLSDEDACGLNLTEEQLNQLSSIQCAIDTGDAVPKISLPDREQQPQNLSGTYSNSKLTIVLFWSAKCAHCLEQMPVFNTLFQKFEPLGLSFYSINLDENKFDWRDYLDANEVSGLNVSDVGSNKNSDVLKQFGVTKTPSVFIIDQNGIVLKKDLFGNALSVFIQAYLEER